MKTMSAEKIEKTVLALEKKMNPLTKTGKINIEIFLDELVKLPKETQTHVLSLFKASVGNRKARMTFKKGKKATAVKVRRGIGSY